ncbi:MAG: iron ABC transporter permease [Treponema sp.]|nr:iron ABC transporter permease [Treponema sp.]
MYTISISCFSTLIAAFVGIVTAYFTSHYKFAARKLILSLSSVPLCVPPLIIALGYVAFFGMNGVVNRFLCSVFNLAEAPVTFLYTSFGIVIAQGFYNFPLVTGIVNNAWNSLPKETENAARLLGAKEGRVFWTITWKNLRGAVAAACMPLFLYCFFSFMIVLLFSPAGHSTLEVELYHNVRSTLNFSSGAKIAVLETITALFIVFVYSAVIRKNQIYNDGTLYASPELRKISGKVLFLFVPLALILILFFFCPFICILFNSFKARFVNLLRPLFTTTGVGILTSLLCCICAFLYSVYIKLNNKQQSSFLQTIPLFPMAVSSVAVSWVATLIFRRGNIFILVLLEVILYWPIAYKQIQNGMNSILKETDYAALLFSKNKFDSIKRVYFPSCRKSILNAFAYCFAVSAGDATLPLVLSIKRFDNLSLYIYKLASAYRFKESCLCAIVLIILCSAVFGICGLINKVISENQ